MSGSAGGAVGSVPQTLLVVLIHFMSADRKHCWVWLLCLYGFTHHFLFLSDVSDHLTTRVMASLVPCWLLCSHVCYRRSCWVLSLQLLLNKNLCSSFVCCVNFCILDNSTYFICVVCLGKHSPHLQ